MGSNLFSAWRQYPHSIHNNRSGCRQIQNKGGKLERIGRCGLSYNVKENRYED